MRAADGGCGTVHGVVHRRRDRRFNHATSLHVSVRAGVVFIAAALAASRAVNTLLLGCVSVVQGAIMAVGIAIIVRDPSGGTVAAHDVVQVARLLDAGRRAVARVLIVRLRGSGGTGSSAARAVGMMGRTCQLRRHAGLAGHSTDSRLGVVVCGARLVVGTAIVCVLSLVLLLAFFLAVGAVALGLGLLVLDRMSASRWRHFSLTVLGMLGVHAVLGAVGVVLVGRGLRRRAVHLTLAVVARRVGCISRHALKRAAGGSSSLLAVHRLSLPVKAVRRGHAGTHDAGRARRGGREGVGSLKARAADGAVRRQCRHSMMRLLLHRGKTSARMVANRLGLLWFPVTVQSSGGHSLIRASLVGRVVQHGANVVNEQRIQQLRDFLLVGKLESTFVGDPDKRR